MGEDWAYRLPATNSRKAVQRAVARPRTGRGRGSSKYSRRVMARLANSRPIRRFRVTPMNQEGRVRRKNGS